MLSNVWSDIRYAARSLSRSPGFTAAAIVTIALGVGVNAGVFTVLNGVLFRDLPAQDAHELVSIQQRVEGVEGYQTSGFGTVSTAEYRAYRDRAQTLAGVLGHANAPRTTLGGEAPQEVFGTLVTCDYFDVLRVPPSLGRALTAADCEPGAAPVVVLGRELWTTRFAADPTILGRTVTLNRQSFAVVGVAAEGTYGGGPFRTAYFAPISAEPLLRSNRPRYGNDKALWLYLIGRRSNATGLDQVRAELDVIAAQIDQGEPGRSTTLTIERATPMVAPAQIPRGATIGAAAVLMTAFGLILLIACSNVANLLLARGTAKSQELGIRLSLGASRARLIRQLLTESMLISVVGGLLGSLLALWLFQVLVAVAVPALSPPEIPTLVLNISPDFRVLAFAVVLTLGTGLLFGLAPALQVSKPDLNAVLKQDTAGAGGGRRGGRLRGALVGVQVALCMTLMIGAGLLLRGLYATYSAEVGFEYRDVAFVSLETWLDGRDSGEFAGLRQRFQDEVAALPGVAAVAYTDQEPLGDDSQGILIRLPADGETDFRLAQLESVTSEYFSLLELPIVRGRSFTAARGRESCDEHASRHRQRNDGPQSLARRRRDRPDAAAGCGSESEHQPTSRRRGSGCASERNRASRSLLRLPAGRRGGALGQEPNGFRRNGFEHPHDRAAGSIRRSLPTSFRWRRRSLGGAASRASLRRSVRVWAHWRSCSRRSVFTVSFPTRSRGAIGRSASAWR